MVDPLNIAGNGLRPPPIGGAPVRPVPGTPAQPVNSTFKDMLADAVSEVQRLQNEADTTIKQLVAGEITDVAQAMIAVEKADISFQTMMTVRNKVMTAYEEIMRMQI